MSQQEQGPISLRTAAILMQTHVDNASMHTVRRRRKSRGSNLGAILALVAILAASAIGYHQGATPSKPVNRHVQLEGPSNAASNAVP